MPLGSLQGDSEQLNLNSDSSVVFMRARVPANGLVEQFGP